MKNEKIKLLFISWKSLETTSNTFNVEWWLSYFSGHVRHDEMPWLGCQKSPKSKCECLAFILIHAVNGLVMLFGKHNCWTIVLSCLLYRHSFDFMRLVQDCMISLENLYVGSLLSQTFFVLGSLCGKGDTGIPRQRMAARGDYYVGG